MAKCKSVYGKNVCGQHVCLYIICMNPLRFCNLLSIYIYDNILPDNVKRWQYFTRLCK